MKVKFDFTLEDLVDVSQRSLARSRVARSWRWQGYAVAGLIGGLLGLVLVPGSGWTKLLIGAAAALLFVVYYHFTQKSSQNRKLLEYMRENHGGDGPFTCEVELTESGLITTQMGTRIKREWRNVKGIEEASDAVEIALNEGLLVVRDRAFHSAAEKQQFIALARRYFEQGRHTPNDRAINRAAQ